MSHVRRVAVVIVPVVLAACTVAPPAGPSVMALPKQGEDFAKFQAQDFSCRNFASAQIGNASPAEAATQSAVGSAVVGTALGAAAGAALGSVGGHAGAGAAIGGAGGLLVGSAAGASNSRASYAALQQGYDVAYTQCMVAGGYTVQQAGYGGSGYYPPGYAYTAPYPYYYGYYGPSVAVGIDPWGPRWRRW